MVQGGILNIVKRAGDLAFGKASPRASREEKAEILGEKSSLSGGLKTTGRDLLIHGNPAAAGR